VHIPFVSGVRQDIGRIAQDNPSQLRQAQNVLFTKKGHLVPRPSLQSREASTQTAAGQALVGSLAAAIGSAVPSGIVAAGFPAINSTDSDTPLACWQGQSYFNRAGTWEFAGTHWSLRQTKSPVLALTNPGFVGPFGPGDPRVYNDAGVAVGKDIVGTVTEMGTTSGAPFLNSSGSIKYLATGVSGSSSNVLGNSQGQQAAANNALFAPNGTVGTTGVWAIFPTAGINGNGPATTAEQRIFTSAGQSGGGIGACTDGTVYYVAFPDSGLGGGATSVVLKVDATGTVLQTLNLVWTAGDMSLSQAHDICYDPASNRLGVVAMSTVTGKVASKIITLVAGTMADAGIEVQHAAGPASDTANYTAFCGVTHNGQMSVVYTALSTLWTTGAASTKMGTVVVTGRAFTSTTTTSSTTLNGAINDNTHNYGQVWWPMFGARVVAGRTLLGVFHSYEGSNLSSQWVVMDLTNLYGASATAERTIAACGPVYGCERWRPSSGAYSDGTRLHFAVPEGLTYSASTPAALGLSTPAIAKAGVRRITLEPQGVQAAHIHGTTLLSGQLMHVFDGNKIKPDHFPEETPYIFNVNTGTLTTTGYGVAGGSLAAGSYSYQATWETFNASGQVIRSGASPILVANGVTINQKVVLQITKPQLWNNYGPGEFVRVRLWATKTNPTDNAPKYLVGEVVTSTPQTGFSETITHSTVATGTEEQLYETIDTLADMRAPGADRGIVVVNERVWVADQSKLYASKLIHPNIATAWNTEDTNVITLPSSLGSIQGLSSIQQTLVVMCSRGAAVVAGSGVDDTGAGQGWTLQIIEGVPGTGSASPRSVAATPSGVAYQAQDGDIWVVSVNGQATPLSRPLRNLAMQSLTTPVDVALVGATPKSNTLLVAHGPNGLLRVLDLETGQWGSWLFAGMTPTNGSFFTAISGALWLQFTGAFPVGSADNFEQDVSGDWMGTGNDAQAAVTSVIETGILRPGSPAAKGWGRLRSVVLNEVKSVNDGTSATYTMSVFADGNDRSLMTNKILIPKPGNPAVFRQGPDGGLEFRTSVQKCAFARVLLSIAGDGFNLEGLDLWVSNTGEKSPSNNRS
jgi:hypothetical protein